MKRTLFVLAGAAAGLCLPLVVASTAVAATPAAATRPLTHYSQQSATFPLPVTAVSTGTVSCPVGTEAVGGGVETNTGAVVGSVPAANGSGWTASVSNPTSTPSSFRAYAVCAAGISRYAVTTRPTSAAANRPTSVTAVCPAGTVAIGGGGKVDTGSFSAALNQDMPAKVDGATARGWNVTAYSGGYAAEVSAVAVCAQAPYGYFVAVSYPDVSDYPYMSKPGVCVSPDSMSTQVLSGGDGSSLATAELTASFPTDRSDFLVRITHTGADEEQLSEATVCAHVTS